jgi:hypothetical protein
VKVGDLVRCPPDDHQWWGGKIGLVIEVVPDGCFNLIRLLVDGDFCAKFGENFLELVSEGK